MDGRQISEVVETTGVSLPSGEPEPFEEPEDGASPAPTQTARTRSSWRRWPLSLAALLAIGAAIWFLQPGSSAPGTLVSDDAGSLPQEGGTPGFVSFQTQGIKLGATGGAAPKVGQLAPDFALHDRDGTVVRLSDFRGKTVVMNFWATWCSPCRKEFPELVKVYSRNASQGLVVLGVDMQEAPEIVGNFADEFGATFPIVLDRKGDVGAQYRLLGLPLTVFIDRNGVMRAQHVGVLTEEILGKKLADAFFTMARD